MLKIIRGPKKSIEILNGKNRIKIRCRSFTQIFIPYKT